MIFVLTKKNPNIFQNLINHLGNLDPYKDWTVTIEQKKAARSTQQNSLYWKWLTIMGKHFGYTKDEMHEELASRFLGMIERKTLSGELIREPRSTTTLNTKEFSEYMTKIEMIALDNEIKLPHPDFIGMSA